MSKKSRKRNKKILGALAAGLGAMALMRGRNQGTNLGVSGTNKAKFTSDAAYMDDTMPGNLSADMGTNRVVAPKKSISFNKRSNRGVGDYPIVAVPKRTKLFSNNNFTLQGDDRGYGNYNISYKKGGRVKGCGIAKRGLGRAMKKGRK